MGEEAWRVRAIMTKPNADGTINSTITESITDLGVDSVLVTVSPGDYSDTTDSNGDYSIPYIYAQSGYTVTVTKAYYNQNLVTGITVTAGQTTTVNLYLVPIETEGSVEGTILDATTGLGLPNVTVTVSGGYSGLTDINGIYLIEDIPENSGYTVTATKTNYDNAQQGGVTVTAGQSTVVNLTLYRQGGTIAGTITDFDTSQPIDSVTVNVTPGNFSGLTNASGYYSITDIPFNTGYTVTATEPDYSEGSVENVTVTVGQTTTVNMTLTEAPGIIAGTISDSETGLPVQSAVVSVNSGAYADTTDVNGGYEIADVPPGNDYSVIVTASSYYDTERDSVMVDNNETTTLNLVLSPEPTVNDISVQITDSSTGKPIGKASLWLSKIALSDSVDENGRSRLKNIPADSDYSLEITSDTHINTTLTGIEKIANVAKIVGTELDEASTGTATITVYKKDQDDNVTLAGEGILVKVSYLDENGNMQYPFGYTDIDSKFMFDGKVGTSIDYKAQGIMNYEQDLATYTLLYEGEQKDITLTMPYVFLDDYLRKQFSPGDKIAHSIGFTVYSKGAFDSSGNQMSKNDVKTAFENACQTWNTFFVDNNIDVAYTVFVEEPTVDLPQQPVTDSVSIIYFTGFTHAGGVFNHYYGGTDSILAADIKFDEKSRWTIAALQTVATHELGHVIGYDADHAAWYFEHFIMEEDTLGVVGNGELQGGDKAGAYFLSNKIPNGTIPFTLGMSVSGDDSLTGNIYVPAGDTLYIDGHTTNTNILNLGDYSITRHTDGLIVLGTQKAFDLNGVIVFDPNEQKIKGIYHSLSAAVEAHEQGEEIHIPTSYELKNNEHVSLPNNLVVKIAGNHSITVPNDSTSLTVGADVTFTKLADSNWKSIEVKNNGTLGFSGNATLEYGRDALRISNSDNVTFQQASKVTINNSKPSSLGVIYIYNCSPTLRDVEITTDEIDSERRGIYITGPNADPTFFYITINNYGLGLFIEETSDAYMEKSIISNLSEESEYGHCIILDSFGNESATIDLSMCFNDIIPDSTAKAIKNENPKHKIDASVNYWGVPPLEPTQLFSVPDSVIYIDYEIIPFNYGAGYQALHKIAISHENPFKLALEFEYAGNYEGALDIYYDIIQNETDTALKRRAIKSIIKINRKKKFDFPHVKNVIQKERFDAPQGYGKILDFLYCEAIIQERQYDEAVLLLTQKANEYKGTHMEVEMLSRAAMVYGISLKNIEKAKEYADRVASINPGEPMLDSIYRLTGMKYDPTLFEDKFSTEFEDSKHNEEKLLEEENIISNEEPIVSIAPNPANPRATIQYTLPEASFVKIEVYSITGQRIKTLVNNFSLAGNYNVIFDGSRFGSGIYLYRFQTDNFRKTGKILILK